MRSSSPLGRRAGGLVTALLIVATVESLARAQPPSEVLEDVDSTEEATPEDSTGPTFGGRLGERPKLTGDWLGARSALRIRGVTFDVSSTQFHQGVTRGGQERSFQY